MDYAVRITQKNHPHFAFDIGVGQVAGMIGTTAIPTAAGPVLMPVNLQARSVIGTGLEHALLNESWFVNRGSRIEVCCSWLVDVRGFVPGATFGGRVPSKPSELA